jgi:hypothetical protein
MKSVFIKLGDDDAKAKEHVLESLSICAHDHTLSRLLLAQYSTATGPAIAIIGDWFDLNRMAAYDYTMLPPEGEYSKGDRPTERLVTFISEYLQTTKNAIVVCENWAADRQTFVNWPWGEPPPVSCFGDNEVYHVVTNQLTDPEEIENAIVSRHHWQTGVCTRSERVPHGDIPDEAFFDEVVRNTKHIFIPAFDGSGYLIWSPTA